MVLFIIEKIKNYLFFLVCTVFIEIVLPELNLNKPVVVTKQALTALDSESKSIRLDIKAVDANGQLYDIEMQNVNNIMELEPRIRYYGSLLDCDTIKKGEPYCKLPNVFIIFVCNFDYKGAGNSIYDFSMRDRYNPAIELQDGRRVILVNCREAHKFPDAQFEKLSKFVQYVQNNTPTDEFTYLVHQYVLESKKKPAEREGFMEYLSMDSKIAYLENALKRERDNLKRERDSRLEVEEALSEAEKENQRLKALLAKLMPSAN